VTKRQKQKLISLALALLILLIGWAVTALTETGNVPSDPAQGSGRGEAVTLTILDVGQGDGTLLRWGDHSVLIDAGEADQQELIAARLLNLGVSKLDLIVATHAHSDHIGGIARLLEVFPVEEFYWSPVPGDSTLYENLKGALSDREITPVSPEPGDVWSEDGVTLHFLGPVKEYEDLNNTSLICRIEAGGVAVMMTGDMEAEAEEDLVRSGQDLRSDLLKAGHHGSSTSTTEAFLRAVDPELVTISCGKDNEYGHPHQETMELLERRSVNVARTDLEGELNFRLENGSYTRIAAPVQDAAYIGNAKSWKYHTPDCSGLPSSQNRVEFWAREHAEQMGYEPCGACDP